ncbi:MAG: cytochrome c family protein [Candidatus Zixiibacteriota bacterium]
MKPLLNKITIAAAVVLGLAFFLETVFSGEEEINFVGANKCKICHNKAEEGAQFDIWSKVNHSQAYIRLASPEAKEAGKKLGIDDPQKSPKCLKCHSTVYNWTEQPVKNIDVKKDGSPRLSVEEGVSCESCHWAGSLYQPKKIMEDFDASVKAGMNPHPEESCVKCHNQESPSWKNDRFSLADGTKVGFDFKQAYEKIKHPNPKLEAAKAAKKATGK